MDSRLFAIASLLSCVFVIGLVGMAFNGVVNNGAEGALYTIGKFSTVISILGLVWIFSLHRLDSR